MAIINEGLQYRLLIDPFLDRVHSRVAAMIEPGDRVIDIACGNGTLALKMAKHAQHVTGGILNRLGINAYHEAFSKSGIFTIIKLG